MSILVNDQQRSVGGKAAVLQELQSAEFRIPAFLVSPDDLEDATDKLGFPLAVRSSASAEDGIDTSFAGQFCSFLNLKSVSDVAAAIQGCRNSVNTPAVAEYCRRNRIAPESLEMHVIVQRMVKPQLAGVAFTVNPMTGAEEVVIEACEGVADDLLAGRALTLPNDHPLVKKYANEITSTAKAIQCHFGAPQDFEFAIEDEILYILQSRPITRIGFATDIGEWTTADFRDGGVSSTVCSPLMWSLYEWIWDTTLKDCLKEVGLFSNDFEAARLFFGRPYWNLGAVKKCVARIPGFVEREFDNDLSVEINYDDDGLRTPLNPLTLLRVLPTAFAVSRFLKQQAASAEHFLNEEFDSIEKRYESPSGDVDPSFRQLVETDFFKTECTYFRTIFALSLAKMDFKMSFPNAEYSALVSALPPLRHAGPVRRMRQMKMDGETDVAPLLSEFRHHYRKGLDIIQPRWDEDREFVEQLLTSIPIEAQPDPKPAYEAAREETVRDLPFWKRRSFHRKLDRLRQFVWLREELRDLSSRMYYQIRQHALSIGQERSIGDDVFFMSFREIFDDNRKSIARNREVYESFRNFDAPNEIGGSYRFEPRNLTGDLRGIAASPGVVEATAHIARSVWEANQLPHGVIMVCPFTDPGWTPILNRVTGVVTETGGQLSHSAVICREFGIPAVLGIPSACQEIPAGARIRLDGNRGIVELL